MKKIGFLVQVLTLIIALPLLTILELNHVNQKPGGKKNNSYVTIPAQESAGSSKVGSYGKMPS